MKKNKLTILVLMIAVGCSRSNDVPTILSHLEKSAPDEKITERKVANLAADLCLKDVFSVSTLKNEIREIEKKYSSGKKVKGKWKHLNLEELPIPQANFLKTHGKRLGDLNNADAIDYSECKDLPCIFNKIYGKEDNVAGYVHYLWFLKMGNYLTAHNTVYGGSYRDIKPGIYNEKVIKLSDYLWSEDELYAFWRLSHMIKSPHTDLNYLTEIQRVPRGEYFGFMSSLTCGLAWSHGIVSLQDGCLTTGSDTHPGTFYESVLHELTHQVDYHEGKKLKKSYRSDEPDYLDVSSFFLNEYKDDAGKTVRQWQHKPGIKLASSYAGTSPAENFAETIAFFRVEGSTTKINISPKHWDFTSKNYFSDKSFQTSDLVKSWMTTHSSLISQMAFKAVGNCSSSSQGFASTFFKKTDFITPLVPSMINCLGAKATEISKEIQSKVKVGDPDGCKVLSGYNGSSDWDPDFKVEVSGLMNKYLKELQTDKAYFAKVQAFYDEIPNRTIANNAFLSCAEIASEETCYQTEVLRLATEKIAPLNLPSSHAQDLAELYLTSHSIADTREYINGYYKAFVLSHKAQIDLEAKELWAKCESIPINDDLPPTGKFFSVGDGYMASSLFNCLNADFPGGSESIVRNLAVGELKVQHPKEEAILHEEVVPELQKSLLEIYTQKRSNENKAALEYIQNDNGDLRKKMLADFVWVKDVLNVSNLSRDCQTLALAKIDFSLTYQLRSPVFGGLAENACRDIHLAPEYNTWLEESKTAFTEKSVTGLEKRIVELGTIKAKACLVQYPIDTNLNRIRFKKDREACLLGEWAPIEAVAINEFSADPLVIKFKVDINGIKSQIETNRRRLQIRVMKENF